MQNSFTQRIQRYLAAALGVPSVRAGRPIRMVGGASREVWEVYAEWGPAETEQVGRDLVIRMDPEVSLLASNRTVEYAMYQRFWKVPGVPVAEPLFNEDDPQWLGKPFFVMTKVAGTASSAALLSSDYDAVRARLFAQILSILGSIAATDSQDIDSLSTLPEHDQGPIWSVQLNHWERVLRSHSTGPRPVTEALIRYLRRNPPPPPVHQATVHGDYRIGNILFTINGIEAILDWEMAHIGDPHEDLAWLFSRNYWPGHQKPLAPGVPSQAAAIRLWEEASGLRVNADALHWWQLFTHVKANAIWITAGNQVLTGRSRKGVYALADLFVETQEMWMLEDMGAVR